MRIRAGAEWLRPLRTRLAGWRPLVSESPETRRPWSARVPNIERSLLSVAKALQRERQPNGLALRRLAGQRDQEQSAGCVTVPTYVPAPAEACRVYLPRSTNCPFRPPVSHSPLRQPDRGCSRAGCRDGPADAAACLLDGLAARRMGTPGGKTTERLTARPRSPAAASLRALASGAARVRH